MESIDGVRTKIMEFVDFHPRIILIAAIILVAIILVFYLNSKGWLSKTAFKGGKRAGKQGNISADEELDSLIESIHQKQKKKR